MQVGEGRKGEPCEKEGRKRAELEGRNLEGRGRVNGKKLRERR